MKLRAIGRVVSEFKEPEELHFACEKGLNAETESRILVKKEFREGLRGLEEFSHVFVLYWLDKANRVELTTHPGPPSVELPRVGLFSSRSQYRPNPIALRLAELADVDGEGIRVRGLDAVDGSPVLDIKPYVPGFDRPDVFHVAPWCDWFGRT
jgi:tRNA (adenine37-N6)-methyltransferase